MDNYLLRWVASYINISVRPDNSSEFVYPFLFVDVTER